MLKKIHVRKLFLFIFFLMILGYIALHPDKQDHKTKDYGVFIGMTPLDLDKLSSYELVVIEPEDVPAEHVISLQHSGTKVYGYLNIGSLEKTRPYADRFQDLSLSPYDGWPEESWIDVSSSDWQAFLITDLARRYADLQLDGFFLDNTDIYSHYRTESVYRSLCTILKDLRTFDLPILINGGDVFVSRCIRDGIASDLFDGVNQETVFTKINFSKQTFEQQAAKDTVWFQNYLSSVKKAGLSIYLLEYRADPTLTFIIEDYCRKNHFSWYNADSLLLD